MVLMTLVGYPNAMSWAVSWSEWCTCVALQALNSNRRANRPKVVPLATLNWSAPGIQCVKQILTANLGKIRGCPPSQHSSESRNVTRAELVEQAERVKGMG